MNSCVMHSFPQCWQKGQCLLFDAVYLLYVVIIFVQVLLIIKPLFLLGKSASEATVDGCKAMTERVGSSAGAITLSNKGEVGIGFTSDRMAWAYQCRGKVYSGVNKDDQFCEDA